MGVLFAFLVTRRHPTQSPGLRPGMRSNRDERCHPLAADFSLALSLYCEVLDESPLGRGCRCRRVHAAWRVWGRAKDSRRSL